MTIRAYVRCSSAEQTVRSQKHALKNWLTIHSDGQAVRWYDDDGYTGMNQDRPAWQALLADLAAGDVVLVFAVDRVTREGIVATLQLVESIRSKGARLESLSEPWLSSDNPAAEAVTAVLAWAAKQEQLRRKARQMEGIAAVREANDGKCPWGGRKPGTRITLTKEKERLVRKLAKEGEKKAVIARQVGLSRKSVYKALAGQ